MNHCYQNYRDYFLQTHRSKKLLTTIYSIVFRKLIIVVVVTLCSSQLLSQDSTAAKQEVWPEVNLYYKLNKSLRVYALYSATKLKNSSYTDGGWAAYLDYFALPNFRKKVGMEVRDSTRGYYIWLRIGYMYSTTPSDAKDPFKLHTFVTEGNFRFYLPYHILLTNKNRFDWRIKDSDFEPRYRPRLTLEKDLHTAYMYFTPNIYGEYYVYFGQKGFDRFRISAGIQTKVTKHIEFETYYVHEFDNGQRVNALNAMGLSLKFYLKHQEIFPKKKKPEK
jgi:hypothetical protein